MSRLCVLYVETLTGVLFWSFDLLGNFRAACFPFETSSGSLYLTDLLAFCEFSLGADIITIIIIIITTTTIITIIIINLLLLLLLLLLLWTTLSKTG